MSIKHTIDAKGLRCPLPLLKAKQGLNQLNIGEYLCVLATDSSSVRDFHTFIELSEHHLVAFKETDAIYQYIIEKGA